MGKRFIRQPSETPNVNNADDARMIRYAYGGYDGYIKGKGAELSHTTVGSTFRINSGVVSLHGYETEIDANGWTLPVTSISTKYYYAVYYEVNLATQDTDIKSTYNTADYPNIQAGDDLTINSTGTARLLLYTFTAQQGVIANVDKKVQALEYVRDSIGNIRSDLATGQITVPTQSQSDNSQKIANTNYVRTAISNFYGSATLSYAVRGSGSLAVSTNFVKRQGNLIYIKFIATGATVNIIDFSIPLNTSNNLSLLAPANTYVFYTPYTSEYRTEKITADNKFTLTTQASRLEIIGIYEL